MMVIDWIMADDLRVIVSILSVIVLILGAGMWIGAVNTDRKSFKDFMSKVDNKIDRILERLPAPSAVQSASPVQLTEFGKKISATADAKAWASDHAQDLVQKTSGKPEFEVFETCVEYVKTQLNDPAFARTIRAVAYEHGTEPEQVQKVYEVELRDRLLAS